VPVVGPLKALLLAVAAGDPDRALDGWKTTNRLRAEIVDGNLDVPLSRSTASRATQSRIPPDNAPDDSNKPD